MPTAPATTPPFSQNAAGLRFALTASASDADRQSTLSLLSR
jgi:hypothetical protein